MDWIDLRAQVIANTGWTWGEVGKLTLPRLKALFDHWRRHPPVHLLVASFLGHEPRQVPEPTSVEHSDDGGLTAVMPAIGQQLHAPQQVRDQVASAATPLEAAQALEAMFFGKVRHVEEL